MYLDPNNKEKFLSRLIWSFFINMIQLSFDTLVKGEIKFMTSDTDTKTKKPTTMAELLAIAENKMVIPKKGDTVEGIITSIGKKSLTLDIGAKTEGIVADKEFESATDYVTDLEVGGKLEAVVVSVENDQGQVLLSLRKAASDSRWDYFTDAFAKEAILEAKGLEVNKGGLIVVVNGTRGFVPSSQFGKDLVGSFASLKGQTIKVKVIEVDKEKNRLIFSERHVSEAEELANKAEALDSVKTGEIYEGVVSGVMHFGLFVTVEVPVEGADSFGHVEGLVHISEISWEKVTHPKEFHAVGDRLKVRVLGVDEKTGKLNLSIKQLSDDPWKVIADKYQIGTTVEGTVSRVEPFGVFVNVETGIDGLIHSSKLEDGHSLTKGDQITVNVESVDPDQRRMSLSLVLTEVPLGYK
jgi:small subunit ribosomal protein S1